MDDPVEKTGLVITRRRGQSIRIVAPSGESVLVTLDRLERDGRVRLRVVDTPRKHFTVSRVDHKEGTK